MDARTALADWSARRWSAAAVAAVAVALAIGIPTDVIPNPVFGRPLVDVTWWAYPQLAITAVLGGLLIATYVAEPDLAPSRAPDDQLDAPGRAGSAGSLLSFLAVGCPTCNKLVVVAIGTSGALDWFAPAQPLLALVSIGLLGWALHSRLRGQASCRIAVEQPRNVNIGR